MDIHQLFAPGPIQCDPHEEQPLCVEWSPAEEKDHHDGHQHFDQRPLPMCENPGITMLRNNICEEEKMRYSQFRIISRTELSGSGQR